MNLKKNYTQKNFKKRNLKKSKKKKIKGGDSNCSCYSQECEYCKHKHELEDKPELEYKHDKRLKESLVESKKMIDAIKSKKNMVRYQPLPNFSYYNPEILKIISEKKISINEYLSIKKYSEENNFSFDILFELYKKYQKKGLLPSEIFEAYKLGGILEICDDIEECRMLIESKKTSIRLMKEQMIKEFCKARNDLDCVGITSPKFVEFLNYFRPKPDNAEYPEEELLDYIRIWNDCPCGSGYNYSSPSVWHLQRSSF